MPREGFPRKRIRWSWHSFVFMQKPFGGAGFQHDVIVRTAL